MVAKKKEQTVLAKATEHSLQDRIFVDSRTRRNEGPSKGENDMTGTISDRDRKLAEGCLKCPACKHARKKQRGFLFWFVNTVEGKLCPQCRAYEKVYGHKAHEKIP